MEKPSSSADQGKKIDLLELSPGNAEVQRLQAALQLANSKLAEEQLRSVSLASECEELKLRCRERQWELAPGNISLACLDYLQASCKEFFQDRQVTAAEIDTWLSESVTAARREHRNQYRHLLGEDGLALPEAFPEPIASAMHVAPQNSAFTLVDTQALYDALAIIGSNAYGFRKQCAEGIKSALGNVPAPKLVDIETIGLLDSIESSIALWRTIEVNYPGHYADSNLLKQFVVLQSQTKSDSPLRVEFLESLARVVADPAALMGRLKRENRLSGVEPSTLALILDKLVEMARQGVSIEPKTGHESDLPSREIFELEFQRLHNYKPIWNGTNAYRSVTENVAWEMWQARGFLERIGSRLDLSRPELFVGGMCAEDVADLKRFWAKYLSVYGPVIENLKFADSDPQDQIEEVAYAIVPLAHVMQIIADADARPELKDYICTACGVWAPHGHREAQEHEDDCENMARVKNLRNWKGRLKDLLDGAPGTQKHQAVSDLLLAKLVAACGDAVLADQVRRMYRKR